MTLRNANLPPLTCLEAFEAAARHGSFTLAAAELNLSQSAISRQIRRLEEDLARPLFRRTAQGIALTPGGERYFASVQRWLRDLAGESAALRRRSGERQLTLATTATLAGHWLAARLPDLQQRYPELEVRLLCCDGPASLELSEFDLGLFYQLDDEPAPGGLTSLPLFDHEGVICVCAPAYRQSHGLPRDAAHLLDGHRLLVLEDHYHDWMTWSDWYQALGQVYKPPAHSLRSNSYQLLLQGALCGQGVVLGWERLLQAELGEGRLCLALPERVPSRGRLNLMQPRHRHATPAMRLFQTWLLEQAQD